MKKLNIFDLKKYLCVGVVDIDELVKDLTLFSNHLRVYRNLLVKKKIDNISVVSLVDNELNFIICADFINAGSMFDLDEDTIVEQLKNAVFEFSAEYDDIVNKKIASTEKLSVSKDFKRVFESLTHLKGLQDLQVENDVLPIPQIDKTIFRRQSEAYDAPLIGLGSLDLFDYSNRCHLITPEQEGNKKFRQMKVFCDLQLNIELLEARYSGKELFGEYHVEKVDDDLHLKSFKLKSFI